MSCTPSWSNIGPWFPVADSSDVPSIIDTCPCQSGSPGALTMPCATSTRKPSTPRSSQNRRTSSNSAWTCGFSQSRSGCRESNRWRYHCPSGTRVQAAPPKIDSQLFGGSSPVAPRPSRNRYRPRSGEPGALARAAWNQTCSSEVWLGTRSTSTRTPRPWARLEQLVEVGHVRTADPPPGSPPRHSPRRPAGTGRTDRATPRRCPAGEIGEPRRIPADRRSRRRRCRRSCVRRPGR